MKLIVDSAKVEDKVTGKSYVLLKVILPNHERVVLFSEYLEIDKAQYLAACLKA